MKKLILAFIAALCCNMVFGTEKVYLDDAGVIRWTSDGTEVSLFGANYCLPSACDYRAPQHIGLGHMRKEMIVEDLEHFQRMRFDGLRLCFWGDRQNSDGDGNLIVNDHLDLLCYLIYEADKRGISMLLSPIATYDSQWPEMQDKSNQGFILTHQKGDLAHSEAAIQAQIRYITQLLNYDNPYTGRKIKDEPNILFIEFINEPAQHPYDIPGMISYIDRVIDAIRATGCEKITFYNLSQDFRVAPAIAGSKVQGSTFAWYPSGLDAGHEVKGNGLLRVDRYEQMNNELINNKAKIVYEFDTPDIADGYMYPAMAREFRHIGAQFAAIFSYDMLRTAPRNLGWKTEFFNMVFTPSKAVSAIIASEVMRRCPRLQGYGYYPENNAFGDFRVSYDECLSVQNSEDMFGYSNDCCDTPKAPEKLKHIVGFGSSPVVKYDGTGIYFLDRNDDKTWTIEVYPDIVELKDPFAHYRSFTEIVRRPEYNRRHMAINLPSLKASLELTPGKYTVNAKGKILEYEPLPAEDFYLSFKDEPSTAVPVEYFVDFENETPLVDARKDGWDRMYNTRSFANAASRMHVGNTYVYKVPDLTEDESHLYPADCTMSFYVGDRMAQRNPGHEKPSAVRLKVRGLDGTTHALLNIVDSKGRGYGVLVELYAELKEIDVPVDGLKPYPAAMLPQDWPGANSYYYTLSLGEYDASTIDWTDIDHIQISMRCDIYPADDLKNKGVELESIKLIY